jgi:hypothetical protein
MPLRPVQKRREDVFFVVILLAILAVNFIGFARSYFLAGMLRAHLPNLWVHLHAVIFTSWLLLLTAQIGLVAVGRVRWHRKLGWLGAVIAMLMLVIGPIALVGAERRHAFLSVAESSVVLVGDVMALVLFGIFVLSGILRRSDTAVHKRLMLFATIAILPPGLSRWEFDFMRSDVMFYGIYLAFPFAVIILDLFLRRRPYAATLLGATVLTCFILSISPISKLPQVRAILRRIQGPTVATVPASPR